MNAAECTVMQTISLLVFAESQSDPETIEFRIPASLRQFVNPASVVCASKTFYWQPTLYMEVILRIHSACFNMLVEVAEPSQESCYICSTTLIVLGTARLFCLDTQC